MKTSTHMGDVPLASFITDTTLSTSAQLKLEREKKSLYSQTQTTVLLFDKPGTCEGVSLKPSLKFE